MNNDEILKSSKKENNSERAGRLVVTLVSLLGALGLMAILYFPLRHLN